VGGIFAGLGFAAVIGLVLGLIVKWLWNAVMPGIFGLPLIGYWQAVGLFLLAHLLLKSPGHHGRHHFHGYRGHGEMCAPHGHSRREMAAKMSEWLNCEEKTATEGPEEPKGA
jgi:hypothetical protein